MQGKDILLGTIRPYGYLEIESGEILLTKISMQAAQSPESAIIEFTSDDLGKMVMVRGDLSGDVLYSANIIEIASPITDSLIKTLIKKDVMSFQDIQKNKDQIAKPESKEVKTDKPKKLCLLVIGHMKSSPGAVNINSDVTEFDFNDNLALRIENKVNQTEIQKVYRKTYKELPDDINAIAPDFVVSLHCNAFNTKASGTEVLYYHKSETGKKMAEKFLNYLIEHLKLPDRGIKPKSAENRGGYLLRYTKAPCVIAEPFFIDNDSDLSKAQEDIEGLAEAYAKAIESVSKIIDSSTASVS